MSFKRKHRLISHTTKSVADLRDKIKQLNDTLHSYLCLGAFIKGAVAPCVESATEMKKYFRLKDMLDFNVL